MKNMVKKLLTVTFCIICALGCSNEYQMSKKNEIENSSTQKLLKYLYEGSDGDLESLSRVLNVASSELSGMIEENVNPSIQFRERIKEVSIYYSQNKESYARLCKKYDYEWKWYDSLIHWPALNPWSFWILMSFSLLSSAVFWFSKF